MTTIGVTPRDCDILCGKGKACVTHPGSRRFRRVIDEYSGRYGLASTKQAKMAITKEIYDMLGGEGSRFLKECNSASGEVTWDELTSLAARDKVSHALRFANRGQGRAMSVPSPSAVPSSITMTMSSSAASDHSSRSNASRSRSNDLEQERRRPSHRRTGSESSQDTLGSVATESSDLPPPLVVPSSIAMLDRHASRVVHHDQVDEMVGKFVPLEDFPDDDSEDERDNENEEDSDTDTEPLDINFHRRSTKAPYYDMQTHSWYYPPSKTGTEHPMVVPHHHDGSSSAEPAPQLHHRRNDTSDTQLINFIMQEPLMEWDLETDNVFYVNGAAVA